MQMHTTEQKLQPVLCTQSYLSALTNSVGAALLMTWKPATLLNYYSTSGDTLFPANVLAVVFFPVQKSNAPLYIYTMVI